MITTSHKPARLARLADMLTTVVRHRHEYAVVQMDVFSGPSFLWAEVVCWVLRRMRKPYILTLHGGNLPQFAKRWPVRVAGLLRSAAIVTAPSGYLKQAMQPYRSDIRLLPNPINVSAYHFHQRRVVQPQLVWLRAFHDIYNPVMAVRVLSALLPTCPETTLTMVGPDKGDGSLQRTLAAVAALGLQRHVTFLGQVPKQQVSKALSVADIFLNTTNFDNTPVSVIEAMACGLCVVSTDVGGMPHLVEQEKDGLLVSQNDTSAMVSAVKRLLNEKGLTERLSQNARAKAEEFDWSRILPQWEALLFELTTAHADHLPVVKASST